MTAEVGGGVYGFTDPAMRNVVDVGGLWNARLIVGTRSLFGVELAYVGTASGLDALGLDDSTVLVASGGEGALRLNILRGTIRPYVFAAWASALPALWRRVHLERRRPDNVLELPVSAGLDFQIARSLTLGGRSQFGPRSARSWSAAVAAEMHHVGRPPARLPVLIGTQPPRRTADHCTMIRRRAEAPPSVAVTTHSPGVPPSTSNASAR
jgi:hypothetical protein